jgi:hypothetical protein
MQTQTAKAGIPLGGSSREDLLRQAKALRAQSLDPLTMALRHPNGTTRYQDSGFLRAVVSYLQPILKIVFQSREVELSRLSTPTAQGELSLRFVLRPDGTFVRYDQANNSDTTSPLEFLHESEDLDEVLIRLARAFLAEKTPLALASAGEIRAMREALAIGGSGGKS